MSDLSPSGDADHELRHALALLDVDDVLALCYRFRTRADRLRLYLDVLRRRSGQRAALAAALICFDLARQGHDLAQREFVALAETLRAFDARAAAAAELIAGSSYLEELWPACEEALTGLDPRLGVEATLATDVEPIELDLFGEEEIEDLESFIVADFDVAAMQRQYDQLVNRFFHHGPDTGLASEQHGFFAETRADVERVELFLRELHSLHDFVPQARSMLAIGELFLATHLRVRSFWGRPNPQRANLVGAGLRHFLHADASVFEAIAYLTDGDAEPEAWPKVALLLIDFISWSAREWRAALEEAPRFYAEEARQLLPVSALERRAAERVSGPRRLLSWRS